MIYKSYIVEENIDILKNNLTLFYGENLGLIDDIKQKIIKKNSRNKILIFDQSDILSNENLFVNEILNISLFEEKKIFFINNTSDKIVKILTSNLNSLNNNEIFLFSGVLEKKSKLRNFFEIEKNANIVPCYQDSEVTLKHLILKDLKNYKGLDSFNLNLILSHSNKDRTKLKNEINKIKSFFINKLVNDKDLEKLLNLQENNDFNIIRDSCISGNKIKTNKFLSSTILDNEKIVLYLASINQRFKKLLEISENNLPAEKAIENVKPPVFWKDKPIIITQAKLWNKEKIIKISNTIYDVELKIKSNSILDKRVIFKKLFVDICNLANASA